LIAGPEQLVDSEAVGLVGAARLVFGARAWAWRGTAGAIPCAVLRISAAVGTRRKLPLGFARQPVMAQGTAVEPGQKRMAVVVAHAHHRLLVALREARIAPAQACL